MRVMLNTYPMAFAMPGGGERQLLGIYSELPEHGIQPLLFDLWQPRVDEVDIVHFFSVVGGSMHFCRFVKQYGLPLVISPNLWIDDTSIDELPFHEIADQLQLADKIVVNSYTEASNYKEMFKIEDDKIQVVKAGIPKAFLEKADPQLAVDTLGLSQEFVLCVGSLHPRKNQLALIKAMRRFPDVKLVLFGHIRDKSYANLCVEEGGDQVLFAGLVPHSAQLLRSAMVASAAFILPSFVESPSMASLEAGAQGAQMILTRIGSEEEYFGDLAHYVDPNNVNDIARALEKVLSTKADSDKLVQLIKDKYTLEATCQGLANVYKDVLQAFNEKT